MQSSVVGWFERHSGAKAGDKVRTATMTDRRSAHPSLNDFIAISRVWIEDFGHGSLGELTVRQASNSAVDAGGFMPHCVTRDVCPGNNDNNSPTGCNIVPRPCMTRPASLALRATSSDYHYFKSWRMFVAEFIRYLTCRLYLLRLMTFISSSFTSFDVCHLVS